MREVSDNVFKLQIGLLGFCKVNNGRNEITFRLRIRLILCIVARSRGRTEVMLPSDTFWSNSGEIPQIAAKRLIEIDAFVRLALVAVRVVVG